MWSLTLALSFLLLPSALAAEGLYPRSSSVLQVDGRSYRDLIEKSNHTTILEFYAPWCGHCKNLAPAFEKAAKSLSGLAKVAAVNCDEESNKPFCGQMGVQGFPTLKIVRPGKKVGKPTVEDYQGQRTAKAIVDAVVEKIPNHVKRLKDLDYEVWLEGDAPKAILFSEKGTVSALLKAIAVDFLGVMDVAQIRSKEAAAVEVFGVDKFPTLVLLPGEGKDPVYYAGEMKKEDMVKFLSQAASPNPEPVVGGSTKSKKPAKSSSTNKSKASQASSSFSKASASHESADSASAKASQTSETMEDASNPTESPDPKVETQKPVRVPDIAPPLTSLPDGLSLQQKCLNTKASTCVLLLLPEPPAQDTVHEMASISNVHRDSIRALASLSEIHHKHSSRGLFPFYQLPAGNSQAMALRKKLGLEGEGVQVVAVNGKRSWSRHYSGSSYTQSALEDWIDAIRMGDSPKQKLPEGLLVPAENLPKEPVKIDFDPQNPDPEALRKQMPEGMDFEIEEISDEDYERMIAQGKKSQGKEGVVPPEEHDEL